MPENSVEAYPKNSGGIPTSGAIHRHINNGFVCIRFSSVVEVTELEGFEAVLTAIQLNAGS